MPQRIARIFEFAKSADSIRSVEKLTDAASNVLAPFGVTSLSTNLIATPRKIVKPGILFGVRWRDWSRQYEREEYHQSDPALRMLSKTNRAFAWGEARAQFASLEGERVMDACRDFTGSADGFVIPIRESDGSLLTAAFSGEKIDLSPEAQPALYLAGLYYATCGRALIEQIQAPLNCPLTARQIECLQWVYAGRTDSEIAMLLGISQATAHNHVEAAKRALNTSKRSVAAAMAWRAGWFI